MLNCYLLYSMMYSMKNIDGKESNTAKEVNTATEFNVFKDTLYYKKFVKHKMKRIQSKNHKTGTNEIKKKIRYHVLMIKNLF